MKLTKEMLHLYAVTDRSWLRGQTLLEQVEQALIGGATLVQLREKELDEDAFLREAVDMAKLCHRYGVPLLINDNVEIARRSGADGVHVGQEDMEAAEEKDMYVLGNVEDQYDLAPNNVLSGLQYEWGNALENIFAMINDGSFFAEGKEVVMINVGNGGLSMTELNDVKGWLTADDIAVIEDIYAKLGENAIEFAGV